MRHCFIAALVAACLAGAISAPAFAEVRFGRNVYIGGHDFSGQRFDRRHRAEIYLYTRQPKNSGCGTRADGRGGWVKVCHLRTLRRRSPR
ncbi:MAG: hypothetical protein WB816_00445 [Methylocystis sp.]